MTQIEQWASGDGKQDKILAFQGGENHGLWMKDLANFQGNGERLEPQFKRPQDNLVLVQNTADEPEEETEAHAPESMLALLRAEDPANLGKGLRSMQGLAEEFATAKDKPKALNQLREGFEGAVKQTDTDFEVVKANFEAERIKLKPEMEPRLKAMEQAGKEMGEAMGKLPKEEQERMKWAMAGYKNGSNSQEFDQAIAKEIGKHPGLLPALEAGLKASNDLAPYMEKAQALKQGMENAMAERIAGRQAYSEVLKEGGDDKRAQRMDLEARAIMMGIPLENIDAIEKRQQGK
ncbi:MAG TPA: hypothetical protein PKW73_04810 [Candidatus Obscuribacter sp.]|nr:hypothetical protein [Candidatus Obscuribacter sp.]HND05818.1 hypothetical protein [Candidatus Obscuribacter sp.]